MFKSGVFLTNLDTNSSFLYLPSLIMCEMLEKIIARKLFFMHQGIFRPNYILNNIMMLIFLEF